MDLPAGRKDHADGDNGDEGAGAEEGERTGTTGTDPAVDAGAGAATGEEQRAEVEERRAAVAPEGQGRGGKLARTPGGQGSGQGGTVHLFPVLAVNHSLVLHIRLVSLDC